MPEQQSPREVGAPDVPSMSYEQARDELASLVRRLESGSVALEDSLALWERGEALGRRCEDILTGALVRLDAAAGQPDGDPPRPALRAAGDGAQPGGSERPDGS